ncbi:hypothetical protein DPMN_172361 [Dreissena polymorpha]|uniref:Uncharacterized protein n=1 Tax=Dreissena polymorpha TaxID=45954 RepID=A0A9D4E0Q2_DREPO|nr:hypothetical protein DPMN_172361 [Dreissena polymorpha]
MCHEDWTTNVPSRVLPSKIAPPTGGHSVTKFRQLPYRKKCPPPDIVTTNLLTKKNAPLPNAHVFQPTTNVLTKFHDDRTINVASRVLTRNAPPPFGHALQPTRTIFELIQEIIMMNRLSKFHENRALNLATRVLTRKNAPPPEGHVFQAITTILNIGQYIIRTNLLTKFHDNHTINVASRVLTRNYYSYIMNKRCFCQKHNAP